MKRPLEFSERAGVRRPDDVNGSRFASGAHAVLVRLMPSWLGIALWLAGASWLHGGTSLKLRSFHQSAWEIKDGLPDNTVNAVLQTRDGYVWLGTDKGLARFDGVRFEVFDTWNSKELHSDHIAALCENRQGGLWIGTKGGGLALQRHGRLSHAGLSSQFITTLCADRQGRLWVGTAGGGLFVTADGNFVNCSTNGGMPDLFVLSIRERRDGTLWFGTRYAGLIELKNDKFRPHPAAFETSSAPVNAIFEDDAGSLWLGTSRALLRLNPGGVESFGSRDGLPGDQILALAGDGAGNVWVGTDAGAAEFPAQEGPSAGKAVAWPLQASVTACTVDREGSVWLATAGSG
jgi:ligand-binding sensor domain-containing protein